MGPQEQRKEGVLSSEDAEVKVPSTGDVRNSFFVWDKREPTALLAKRSCHAVHVDCVRPWAQGVCTLSSFCRETCNVSMIIPEETESLSNLSKVTQLVCHRATQSNSGLGDSQHWALYQCSFYVLQVWGWASSD